MACKAHPVLVFLPVFERCRLVLLLVEVRVGLSGLLDRGEFTGDPTSLARDDIMHFHLTSLKTVSTKLIAC